MKKIIIAFGLFIAFNTNAQTVKTIRDTTFTLSADCYYGMQTQSDYSWDMYRAEVQGDKLVIIYENDESKYSLTAKVFLLNTIDKEALKVKTIVGGKGTALLIKGMARTFDLSRTSETYTKTEYKLYFNTDENVAAYVKKTFDGVKTIDAPSKKTTENVSESAGVKVPPAKKAKNDTPKTAITTKKAKAKKGGK